VVYFGFGLIFTSSNTLKYFPSRRLLRRAPEELSVSQRLVPKAFFHLTFFRISTPLALAQVGYSMS
jgi:hypothetical protein